MMQEYLVPEEAAGTRIDKFLADACPDLSRSFLQKLLKESSVTADGKAVKSSFKVNGGETIAFEVPKPQEAAIEAENIPLDILYEDSDIILVNKPKGMVVHPAAGHYTGTLVNALMYHCKDQLSGINGVMRPGIVHRIDMNTTGVLVVCKNDFAHNSLAEQLKVHSITRVYYAIVFGNLREDEGTVHAPIGRHPVDRKRMAVNERSRITAYWNASGRIHLSSAAWRRDAHTRSASIWQASVIRFWAMRCTVRRGSHFHWKGRPCMRES